MFTITVKTNFSAKHQLTMPNGRNEPLHSHDWGVETAVTTKKLDHTGLAVEFNGLKAAIDEVVAPFNGVQLENLNCFERINSSAENVAKFIYETVEKRLPADVKLEYVEVTEQMGCSAKYWR